MKIDYILTSFSPAMFGERATVHIRMIGDVEAEQYVDDTTKIVSSRVSHERLAKNVFPEFAGNVTRFASLGPGQNAIHLQYRGAPISDDGVMAPGSSLTMYLIEAEEYAEA